MVVTTPEALTIGQALDLLGREVEVKDPWGETFPDFGRYENRKIHLPNGWVVSVGFGTRHDCANFGPHDPALDLDRSADCEVALFTPKDEWFAPHVRQVWGKVSADDLLAIVDAVATYRDGGPCPCPDCVRDRRKARNP